MREMRSTHESGPASWPCVPPINDKCAPVKTCAKLRLPTQEEAEAQEREREEHIQRFLAKNRLGICATCDAEATDWAQNGHCIYAKPCGHRVGQGDAAKYKAGVLEARAAVKP